MTAIWEHPDWPYFTWSSEQLAPIIRELNLKQGRLLGKCDSLDDSSLDRFVFDNLVFEAKGLAGLADLQTSHTLIAANIAHEFGFGNRDKPVKADPISKTIFELRNDIEYNLSEEQIDEWLYRLKDKRFCLPEGETVLKEEVKEFLSWYNHSYLDPNLDPFIRAGLANLWMAVLTEFMKDLEMVTSLVAARALAQGNPASFRFYSIAPIIFKNRETYQKMLKQTLVGTLDVTHWLKWFLKMLLAATELSISRIDGQIAKIKFLQNHKLQGLNSTQQQVIETLLNKSRSGQLATISASDYQSLAHVSKATATRHLSKLLETGCLQKLPGGGRSTRYEINLNQ